MDRRGLELAWVWNVGIHVHVEHSADMLEIYCEISIRMTLIRKLRRTGGSLLVAIPKDLVDYYDISKGEVAMFEPLGERTLRVKIVSPKE